MTRSSSADPYILHTIRVLSAYANIRALAPVFRETGALQVLTNMLSRPEKEILRSACDMLRALASHDAGSRAHVLLSLSHQDGIDQHMDFESRCALLQLFAETTSSEEHCISLDGIYLPQVPGPQLFSLVKRYLCVTSMLSGEGAELHLQRRYEVSMATGRLLCDLLRVMGWKDKARRSALCRERARTKLRPQLSRRSDEAELRPGVSGLMVEDLDPRRAGDEGAVRSIGGHPPLQVHWHRPGHRHPAHRFMGGVTKPITRSDPAAQSCDRIRQDEWWEIVFFVSQLEDAAQRTVMEMAGGSSEGRLPPLTQGRLPPPLAVSVDVAQKILAFLVENCQGQLLNDLQSSHVYDRFYGKIPNPTNVGDLAPPTDPSREGQGAEVGGSDLQILNTLLLLEGLELSENGEDTSEGPTSNHDTEIKRSLETCRLLAPGVRHVGLENTWKCAEDAPGALSEKMVAMLVELLTSQVKDKLLVVTCLQLTYLVLSKYEWGVSFATEGGLRAVLECMRAHKSSAAVQHIGLAVLKVLTGVDGSDLQGPTRCKNTNPGDSEMIKEIFFSIGSAASSASGGLLSAIPSAIAKMISVGGFFSSAYNGLLVLWILMENHTGLSEQLCTTELSCVLQRISEDSSNSLTEPQRRLASLVLNCCQQMTAPDLAFQKMDISSLLSALKDDQMSRGILLSLERCVGGDVSLLQFDVPQLLTDPSFFLRLLSCLEDLKAEKRLQLCVYRILNKALHLYEEDALPWHKTVSPSLRILEASRRERELFQEVVRFLHSLAVVSKDCTLVMCSLGTGDILDEVLDEESCDEWSSKLRELLAACDQYTAVHNKMAAFVVAGCLQTVLSQIDEHRLRHQRLAIPLLDVFLHSLAAACTGAEQDKCWQKIEVSSNSPDANNLTDGNPKSYWQSNGSAGSHHILIYMLPGVVIRRLVMVLAYEDSSYSPAKVVVMGGENPRNINTKLKMVDVSRTARRVVLLQDAARFWPVIQLRITSCHQGGVNTRVRGLEIRGPQPMFWPMFMEHLCRRSVLFYSCKAQSWGKEIQDKKENLLLLFRRLRQALSYEQEFADRFLPNAEAAEALGRTCKEALILPLVNSMTSSSDPGGVSSFGWLLTHYLENNSGSRLSTFNSRVRRLTQLLVNVVADPPQPSVPEPTSDGDKKQLSSSGGRGSERTASSGGRGSERTASSGGRGNGRTASSDGRSDGRTASSGGRDSMAAMAQCWQEVVQQQVQHFLETSWNAEDVVPQICSMHTDLRRAAEEMFGQHVQFVLAVQRGFRQAMLQLPSSTTLHVTEQCALYIDRRIVALHSDSSDSRSMEELEQFLHLVPFLSPLELSNHYECYYRYYLADRLFTIGCSWLEDFVVARSAICFPNQFPQQMLESFQEAKDLQRGERLHRLQELDMADESEDEGKVTANDGNGTEEGLDVDICLLSAHCWPSSADLLMDNPQKYFPPEVTRHLLSSTNVLRQCTDSPGQSRRLQWMWLGNAEIQYGRLTLRVSTLQMFILLHFNQQEEISEEAIRSQSGVSDAWLRNSLQPLTGNNGILAVHKDTGGFYLNTSALCDQTGTVLNLCPARGFAVPDSASLEEKRRLILEEIDRIIKEERHLHINTLVAKVLEASRKRTEASLGCTPTDVLSCVLGRIRGGAIYRKTTNPLVLCCKEDPPPTSLLLSPLFSHHEPAVLIPPQVSEFCRVRKVANNIGVEPEERPKFQTFRYPE